MVHENDCVMEIAVVFNTSAYDVGTKIVVQVMIVWHSFFKQNDFIYLSAAWLRAFLKRKWKETGKQRSKMRIQ